MKNNPLNIYWLLIPSVFIVVLDEYIKFIGLKILPDESNLQNPNFFNLGIHKNLGLAFDIPFRVWVIVLISIIFGYFLFEIAYKNRVKHPKVSFASLLIIIGALGNLFDRIVYGFTVDYMIFFGRSAINISDLLIILGVVLLLLFSRKSKLRTDFFEN